MQETKLVEIYDQSELIQKWMNLVNKCLEEQWKDTNYLLYYAKKWKDSPPPHPSQFTPGEIIHQMSKAGIRIMQKSIDLCQDLSETVVFFKKKENDTNHLNAAENNFLIFQEKNKKMDPFSLSLSSFSFSSSSSSSLSTLSLLDVDKNNYGTLQLSNRLSYYNENELFPFLMTNKKNVSLLNDSTSTIVKDKNNSDKKLYDSSSHSYPSSFFFLNNNNNNPITTSTTSIQCQDCFFCQTAMPLENNIPFYSSTTGNYHPFISSSHSFSSIESSFIKENKKGSHHQGISYQQQHEQFLSSLASLPSLSVDSIDDFSLPPIEIQTSSFSSLKEKEKEKEDNQHNYPLSDQQQSYLLNLKRSISFYFYQENQFVIFKKNKKSSSSLKGKERTWIQSWAEKLSFTSLFLFKKKKNKVHPMK